MNVWKGRSVAAGAATAVALALAVAVPAASTASAGPAGLAAGYGSEGTGWAVGWAASAQPPTAVMWRPNWSTGGLAGASLRQVIRTTAGGSYARIRLSNRYGTGPLRVTGASVAKAAAGAATEPGTVRPLTFDHQPSTTIPAGAEATSDPVRMTTSALESLTITLYFAGNTGPATFHGNGLTTAYRAAGDHRFDPAGTAYAGETSSSWYFLAGVEVYGGADPGRGTVVAFGDSLTDGYRTTPGADNRYPDELAERLAAAGRPTGVANAGISGNRLLTGSPCFGDAAVTRFGWDVLDRPEVRTAVVVLGINDIGMGGSGDFGCGAAPVVTAERLIEGHRSIIARAHASGIRVIGGTIPPVKGNPLYYSPEKEAVRDAVNHWILTSGEYDEVVDFAHVLADPSDPDAMLPAYDSGDHLHPNDAGAAAMAAAIDLGTL